MKNRLTMLPGWAHGYRREWLRLDVVAGLTTAAVVVPKAMAYATMAGLPLQVGLYTALIPMVAYALLGSSAPLSVSTTTTLAILTAAELSHAVPQGDVVQLAAAATTLTLIVGGMLIAARMLRLGFLANFISEPVLTGFKAGIGLVIVADQIPKLLGIHIDKVGFLRDLTAIVRHLPEASGPTALVALAMIVIMVALERFAPRAPGPLLAVAAGIAASVLLGLPQRGVETVGSIPSGLPPFAVPDLSLARVLWPGALGIALMSFTESVAAGRAFVNRGEPRPNVNRELFALGTANALASFFGSMPAGGGTSQTAVNRRAGARSQLAAVVTAAAAAAALLFLAPVIGPMPQAVLAAVVIVTSVGLIDPTGFRRIRRVRTMEFRWALTALVGVVVLGTLRDILVAVIVSLVSLASRAQNPPVYAVGRKRGTDVFRPLSPEHPDDETYPGLLVVRVVGAVHFANGQRIGEKIWSLLNEEKPRVVVIDGSAITDIEYTAVNALMGFEDNLATQGMELWLAALNPEARRVIERSPLYEKLGRERMFFNVQQAVGVYQDTFGSSTK